jgi:hypothetical protein
MSTNTRGYWISGKHVAYFNSAKIPGADAASFQILNDTWATDRRHAYSAGRRIAKADVNSFQVLNGLYAKDANYCYYLGGIIKEADAKSFQVLDDGSCVSEYHNGFGDHVHTEKSAAGFAADEKQVFHYVFTIGKPCVLKKAHRASLNAACRVGNTEMVKLLLDAGCDPRITDAGHNSCLTELYCNNHLEIAKLLVEAGADVNHMEEYSPAKHGALLNAGALRRPLEHALFQRRFDLADYLISVGADVNATTGEGYRLVDFFRRLNNAAAVDYLVGKGA